MPAASPNALACGFLCVGCLGVVLLFICFLCVFILNNGQAIGIAIGTAMALPNNIAIGVAIVIAIGIAMVIGMVMMIAIGIALGIAYSLVFGHQRYFCVVSGSKTTEIPECSDHRVSESCTPYESSYKVTQ